MKYGTSPLSTIRFKSHICRLVFILAGIPLGLIQPADAAEATSQPVTRELREEAVEVLRDNLTNSEGWEIVHAAEALIRLDYRQGVDDIIDHELATCADGAPYRIGLWRVKARLAYTEDVKTSWLAKIRDVLLNGDESSQATAAETLGKLGYKPTSEDREALQTLSEATEDITAAMATWALLNEDAAAETRLLELLESQDEEARLGSAYALRFRKIASPEHQTMLYTAAHQEPIASTARPYLLSAAAVLAGTDESVGFKEALLEYALTGDKDAKYELCEALAEIGNADDLPTLVALMDDDEPDVRGAAANAVLRIERRISSGSLTVLDWIVIGVYLVGMLAIGWYYARRTNSAEEYLLGGRNMKPWTVGLSLFATLLSTLSYLFVPGEMVKYGPMILTQLAMYPLIVLVVGRFLIPHFMKMKVSTAYEILESRLGVGVRLLGSVIFLLLRLLWMGVIIYATTDKVLVPMAGLSPASTPWICIALGVITVLYTSMGGLRAVVLTDVLQTFILFGGAILAIATITFAMGGVGAWWPDQWVESWPEPAWFELDARVSFLGASIGVFFWWICTAGSDQMAIQRYLATRDVKAARRAFAVAMCADAAVCLFLSALGFAILAYFQAHPHMVPAGETIYTGADKLFPRFIVFGLPVGVSGLIIAGLLAAAMSSLSSGINASCSVITVDFIDRFKKSGLTERGHVRMAQYMSVLVGAVVVGLSFYVSVVPGNLLEVVYKVVNLFTGTLFVLFFLAMFVPWSKAWGAWSAAVCSTAVAVIIAYWELFTGRAGISFLWITPISLATGIIVGSVVSLLPPGRKRTSQPTAAE